MSAIVNDRATKRIDGSPVREIRTPGSDRGVGR